MYAIIEVGGKQFKVQENDKVYLPHFSADVDETVTIDRVLLVSGDGDIQVGQPVVDGASVSATVLGHVKGNKVLVFRKKRRKRFKVLRGHRQWYTQVEIGGVSLNGNGKAKQKKAEPEPEPAEAASSEDDG